MRPVASVKWDRVCRLGPGVKAYVASDCASASSALGTATSTARGHRGLQCVCQRQIASSRRLGMTRPLASSARAAAASSLSSSSSSSGSSGASGSKYSLPHAALIAGISSWSLYTLLTMEPKTNHFAHARSIEDLTRAESGIDEAYQLSDEILGEGGYCVVRKGVDRRTGEVVAVKELSKRETSSTNFWTEVDLLKTAGDHPNIMRLHGVYETKDCWYIVQELAADGELFDHLVQNGAYSERQASTSIRDLCDALHYLHRKGIVHGDVKPENILLHEDRMCLVDFGVSFRMGENFGDIQRHGTIAYSAPETLVADPMKRRLGPEADMFALGIVIYILLCGAHPFDTDNNLTDEDIRQRILSGEYHKDSRAWRSISPTARDLIEKLLEPDPSKRLTSTDALVHPWFAETAQLSQIPLPESAEQLEKFQRGRRRLRASILAILLEQANLGDDKPTEHSWTKRRSFGARLLQNTPFLRNATSGGDSKNDVFINTLRVFDREGKGFISSSDLKRVVEQLGMKVSDAEINEMLTGSTGDPDKHVDKIAYEDVKMAMSTLRTASYAPGEIIIREGAPGGRAAYLILDGEVEVSCHNFLYDEKKEKGQKDQQGDEVLLERHPTDTVILKRLRKGQFFGEAELMGPDGQLHPRIATYRCAPNRDGKPCKVLKLFEEDVRNVSGIYSSMNKRFAGRMRSATQEQLIKCVEASKDSIRRLAFDEGEYVYHEGDACDSFFIITDGEVEVFARGGQVIIENLQKGDFFPIGVTGLLNCKMYTRNSSVRCTKRTHMVEISGETFRSFLRSSDFMLAYFRHEIEDREENRVRKKQAKRAQLHGGSSVQQQAEQPQQKLDAQH